MAESDGRREPVPFGKSIASYIISCFFVFISQLALASVSRFFSAFSFLAQLCLSAAVLLAVIGLGGRCRRLIGVPASGPAFVVSTIVYTWLVHTAFVRPAVPFLMNILFNGEVILLLLGLCRMFTRDPGFVAYEAPSTSRVAECTTEKHSLVGRARFCRICNAYVKGYDHHCPAFGNCIGQNNYLLFMALLVGFLCTEASFMACSYQFLAKLKALQWTRFDNRLVLDVTNGALLFAALQMLWQVIFFAWHVHCVCFNIRTEEWVNWKKYPEFQMLSESDQVDGHHRTFRNPYDKGIVRNVKELLTPNG